jgi:hypothetical protein
MVLTTVNGASANPGYVLDLELNDSVGSAVARDSSPFGYRTKESFGNVLQKGQATTTGGQVKFQQPGGKLTCMFKTPQGTATAGSGATLLNDYQWHTVRCDRTPTSVTTNVDGVSDYRFLHGPSTARTLPS